MTKAATVGQGRRRKPSLVPLAGEDWGSDTAAARRGTTLERVPQDANQRRRRRRLLPWEDPRSLGGKLTQRQAAAAQALYDAHAATERSPSQAAVRVDKTPDPALSTAMMVDVQMYRAKVWRSVPKGASVVVQWVCANGLRFRQFHPVTGRPLVCNQAEHDRALAALRYALDCVAAALRL